MKRDNLTDTETRIEKEETMDVKIESMEGIGIMMYTTRAKKTEGETESRIRDMSLTGETVETTSTPTRKSTSSAESIENKYSPQGWDRGSATFKSGTAVRQITIRPGAVNK